MAPKSRDKEEPLKGAPAAAERKLRGRIPRGTADLLLQEKVTEVGLSRNLFTVRDISHPPFLLRMGASLVLDLAQTIYGLDDAPLLWRKAIGEVLTTSGVP